MVSEYSRFREEQESMKQVHTPVFFRLKDSNDKQRFDELVNGGQVMLHDELYDQLKELIKSRNPKVTLSADDHARLIAAHMGECAADNYGVWVYYPWSHRAVHILDEQEFVELRTAANKNKITIKERDLLSGKKVGVIGLSVGQSVSLTLALERGCGELRLADFDTLELNNLNRIRTGVHNLGILKAHIVAREIAEIDPYFKVVCYTEGITDDNIDDFFLSGGKLDAVIDECDGINIKILCRIKAKSLQVPVLMEASDRATLDVERFDLEPDRPIMHGWLEHLQLDMEVLRNLKTNEEKIPYILPISGLETLSTRMQASMIEMRNTLTTWPQLASAVTLGGALTADTCRRIFLDQYTDSGRYFIDLEQLVPDKRPKEQFALPAMSAPLTEAGMKHMAADALKTLDKVDNEPRKDIIETITAAAIMAPSAGNSQPWKWLYTDGYLFLFFEYTGVTSFGDGSRHMASHLAHGAALENLRLKVGELGMETDICLFPLADKKELVAAIGFRTQHAAQSAPDAALARQIDKRQTCRTRAGSEAVSNAVLQGLESAIASVVGAKLTLITDRERIGDLANIVGPMERLKMLNAASHYEFYNQELRWAGDDRADGIREADLGISQPEIILLKMAMKPEVAKLLHDWNGGQALEYTPRSFVNTAAAIGLLTIPGSAAKDHITGGIAMERLWLAATQHNIGLQPMMTPILFFEQLRHNASIPMDMKEEIATLRELFNTIFPIAATQESVFLFKLSTAFPAFTTSSRKQLNDVLTFN